MTASGLRTVTVETVHGAVEGREDGGIAAFRGLPFGRVERWAPPQPPAAWSGVRPAQAFGPLCPQNPRALAEVLKAEWPEGRDEDCLTLNVWTPGCDGAKRPVLLWIHGGAFLFGTGASGMLDGGPLARHGDAVIVTLNYRLGAFGFLRLADITGGAIAATGDEGLLDVVAALAWLRDNIAAFGGDPANITVFGESAGAMIVGALLAAPSAKGLFHKAILQSGSTHVGYSRERAARVAAAFLEAAGIAATAPDALRAMTTAEVLGAMAIVLKEARDGGDPRGIGRMPFQPVIDGTVLPEPLLAAVAKGSAAGVPVMAGTNTDEWMLFTGLSPEMRAMTPQTLSAWIEREIPPDAHAALEAAYSQGTPFDRFNLIQTDRVFRVPVLRLLQAHAAHGATYNYLFDWPSPYADGALGSCHALEIGLVFGTQATNPDFFGSGPTVERISREMGDAWTSFAREGRPTVRGRAAWPPFDAAQRAAMRFAAETRLERAPLEARRQVWDSVPDARMGSTL